MPQGYRCLDLKATVPEDADLQHAGKLFASGVGFMGRFELASKF
jgi:hypothetical protein